jgi:glycosyltransferase involved in cell wall biosynthesis
MHLKNTKLNIIDDIAQADFLIQLSDNEGYCYSIVEALNLGIPVVVTPIPVFKEIGLDDTNSITLDFDCSNVAQVAEQIATKEFHFKYTPIEDS